MVNTAMVAIAVSSMLFHEYPCEEIFSYVEEAGLDGIEFWVETPHFWLQGCPPDALAGCIARHPRFSRPTIHAPVLDLNPCSINPRVAIASVEYAVEAVSLGAVVESPAVTVHPGRRTAKRTPSDADYRRFERYLDLLEEAHDRTGVPVSIENMERRENSLLCTPAGVAELLEEEPWLGFTLDVAHALVRSLEEVLRYVEIAGDRLCNVHVSGVVNGLVHVPPSRDDTVAPVLEALRDTGYTGPLTLEIEDRTFNGPLSSEEKILLLMREAGWIRSVWDG